MGLRDLNPEQFRIMESIEKKLNGQDGDFVASVAVTLLANLLLGHTTERDFSELDAAAEEICEHIKRACRALHAAGLN